MPTHSSGLVNPCSACAKDHEPWDCRTGFNTPCEEDDEICLEHLNPYMINDEPHELDHNDRERNRLASQPLYKKIGFQV